MIFWAAVIFFLSSQPAESSDKLSKGVTEVIIKAVDIIYPLDMQTSTAENWINQLNGIVRQYAHTMVFLILALFVLTAVRMSGFTGFRAFSTAFVFCMVYALTDEIHQIFVPGRAWELTDLIRDCSGVLMGLVLYSLAAYLKSPK